MNEPTDGPRTLTANMELALGTQKIKFRMVVPEDEVPPDTLVPTLQQLTNIMMDGVENNAREQGYKVSCQKGCGACCRQLIPVSRAEARQLAVMVENMPEPRRSELKKRFDEAAKRLRDSGLEDEAVNFHRLKPHDRVKLSKQYFDLGIACPFLEDECCSIHEDRPLVCREYLVVSSPKHCATLDGDNIERLRMPVSIFSTFCQMEGTFEEGENPFLVISLALEWFEEHGWDCQVQSGPAWVQQFFGDLSGAEIPDPDGPDTMLP